ncbi:hypothetical protein N7492_002907 [Penicillium capsulatum]|uniref:Small EDRK-rich factor-like N-terminal domain-containing protein n=1 Tax=Penicillium capsulatum TaxID=69766 RepID=A0A9W9IKZ8_9EURO|nr:hypothetical protein N7492_002907 [Penicillium capsulatum]KAJ6122499.1 hypothetical protein N7512_004964 [Penicillium capsulatum]
MTRGNQRDNDRAKAQKKAASAKTKNTLSGSQYQKSKEDAAMIMREKQRKGRLGLGLIPVVYANALCPADEKKAAEAAAGKKK